MPVPTEPGESRQYVCLANLLRSQITGGTLGTGMPAPSITQLAQRYGIARGTARKALRLLEAEGRVHRSPGLAYHVTGTAPGQAGTP